jgi:hypothetical protein
MAVFYGQLRGCVVLNFDKTESAGLAGETVAHDGYGIYSDAVSGKEILEVGLIRRVREISYKELFHLSTPQNTEHYATHFEQSQRGLLLVSFGHFCVSGE